MTSDPIALIVSDLIDLCARSEDHFDKAADIAEDAELAFLFHDLARQRSSFAQELRSQLGRLRGAPCAVVQFPIDALLPANDLSAMVYECWKSEETIRDKYQQALAARMPSEIRSLLYRQSAYVMASLERMRDLELPRAA